jgi:hypothetical protein
MMFFFSTYTFGIFQEDVLSFILILQRSGENLLTFRSSLFDGGFFYPYTKSLLLSDNMLFSGALFYIYSLLFKPPLLALNMLLLTFLFLNFLTMYFFLKIFLKRIPSLFGALIFSISMIRLGHACHIHLFPQFFFPLLALGLAKYEKTQKRQWLILSGLSVSLQFYFSLTLGMILIVSLIPYGIWKILNAKKKYSDLLMAAGLSLITILPLAIPFAIAGSQGTHRKLSDAYPFSANLKSYFTPLSTHPYYSLLVGKILDPSGVNQERFLFIGFVVFIFALYGLYYLQKIKFKYRKIIFISFAFCILVSFGTNAGIYNILFYIFPGLNGFRTPARFGLTYLFFMSVFAAIGLQKARLTTIGLVFALFLLENFFTIPSQKIDTSLLQSSLFLKTIPKKEAVFYYPPLDLESIYMYQSAIHGHPIGNGFAGHNPAIYLETKSAIENYFKKPTAQNLEKLTKYGFKYAVNTSKEASPIPLKRIYSDDKATVFLLTN